MMNVAVDARARQAIGRGRPEYALLVTVVTNYGLPAEALSVEWCRCREAENDPTAVPIGAADGVPLYAHERLAAFARWRTIVLTAKGLPWWPRLAVADEAAALDELRRWECAHPGLRAAAQPAAA